MAARADQDLPGGRPTNNELRVHELPGDIAELQAAELLFYILWIPQLPGHFTVCGFLQLKFILADAKNFYYRALTLWR